MKTSTLIALATLLAAPAAMAQLAPDPSRETALGEMAQYIRTAHKPFTETTESAEHGRTDRHFHTTANWEDTVQYYRGVYARQEQLSHGVKCIGYFIIDEKRLATFTLTRDGQRFMVYAKDSPDGTTFTLYGIPFQRRETPKQRPYHRGHPDAPTRSYGL